MAKVVQIPYNYDIVLPVSTAQAVQENHEKPISLEALGLLVNLISYPTKWELHKTELYKRFAKNKETSVRKAWKELMNANYIIEFKYRVGKKWEYVYYLRKVPFTDEEKNEILQNARNEYGEIWGLDFQDLKMKSSKPRGNQIPLSNKKPLSNSNNHDKDNIDDDKRTSSNEEDSSKPHSEEEINLLISNFREMTKNDLTNRSFKAIVRKVMDKYNQGKINSFRDYLATALANKIYELEFRKAKEEAKIKLEANKQERIKKRIQTYDTQPLKKDIPLYNWLEE